jgi:copper homeostasis protein
MGRVSEDTAPEDNPWDDVPLLEVVVLHVKDVVAATDGGADRLLLVADPGDVGISPDLAAVSAIVKATDLPVRVMLRHSIGYEVTPEGVDALAEFAEAASALGAAGFSFGFLDSMLEVDVEACSELASRARLPWTFHRGFDASLNTRRAWRDVLGLPGLDAVASAGSSRGMSAGADELLQHAANPRVAALLMASGALEPEQVPWLVRAGVRQFGVGATVRPGRSWTRSFVDVDHVRAWRMLLDDAVARARGIPVD